MFSINNLHTEIDGQTVSKIPSLPVNAGEVLLMVGSNGAERRR